MLNRRETAARQLRLQRLNLPPQMGNRIDKIEMWLVGWNEIGKFKPAARF
jgi:hypothetical protein